MPPGIYKIESKIKTKRIYIGSTIDIIKRKKEHLYLLRKNRHPNVILQRHYNKYSESDLKFSILLGCNKEDLIKTEQHFIDSYNPYFNLCKNAGNTLGRKFSEETKRKFSEQRKGMIPWNKNKKGCHSQETINKIIEKNKKYLERIGGRHHSEETKLKIGKSHIGINPWKNGRCHSEETKKKIRESNVRTWSEKKRILELSN